MTPRVSILIPAYNAAPWIERTLASALGQSWPNVEVIVVDDGSTDETAAVVSRVSDARVRLIQQGRRGPSVAQNTALSHATGDFIQRLDADDLLSPDKIAVQMARLAGETRGAVAAGQWARFTTDPSEARFRRTPVCADLAPVEWLRRECSGGLPMLHPGLWLAPRAVVEAAGPWDERLTLNNDFDYGVRLLLASDRVLFCNDARLYYRSGNPGSLASARSASAWESALLSLELGTDRMLQADSTLARPSADLFQQLAYAAFVDEPAIAAAAQAHAIRLGGSRVPMDGGFLFRGLRDAVGWRMASRLKHAAYQLGYARVARLKEAALGREAGA